MQEFKNFLVLLKKDSLPVRRSIHNYYTDSSARPLLLKNTTLHGIGIGIGIGFVPRRDVILTTLRRKVR